MKKNASRFDVRRVRRDFPIFQTRMHGKPLIYLDSAATAQKPQAVIEAISNYYTKSCASVHRSIYELAAWATDMYESTREKVRAYLHAQEREEIVFTSGTTESINLIALSAGETWVRKGDEIIISEMEHHSNFVPWQFLAQRKGAKLHIVPIDERGELKLDVYKLLLSERTKIVSLPHMSNAIGTINPVREIVELAHRFGAKVILDGAQAAQHLFVDVEALDVDFYVFSGHKLYGPTGVGVLYGKKKYLEELPPVFGGGDMIERVEVEKTTFQPPPLKFEAGTPKIAQVIGLGAAIDYIESVGREAIFDWEEQLLTYALSKLKEVEKLRVIGNPKKRGSVISFTLEGVHPLDLATALSLKGVAIRTGHLCAQPLLKRFGVASLSRISFGMYTTYEEIEALIQGVKDAALLLHSTAETY